MSATNVARVARRVNITEKYDHVSNVAAIVCPHFAGPLLTHTYQTLRGRQNEDTLLPCFATDGQPQDTMLPPQFVLEFARPKFIDVPK